MLTLESERLVLASRLPVPTVVPDRILLLGSERLVRRGTAATRTLATSDRTWLFGSERVVVAAVEPLAAGLCWSARRSFYRRPHR
jgi:hypothetical protein